MCIIAARKAIKVAGTTNLVEAQVSREEMLDAVLNSRERFFEDCRGVRERAAFTHSIAKLRKVNTRRNLFKEKSLTLYIIDIRNFN